MLQAEVRQELIQALKDSNVGEICGFILMDRAGSQSFRQVPNFAGPIGAFLISSIDWSRTFRDAEARGLEVIAIVHSHMSSVKMNDADRRSWGILSIPFVIVRLHGDALEFRVYQPRRVGKNEA